jgi:glycosyltransferase involved in cell wall biosynthesis
MRIGFEAKRATHNFRGLGNYSRGLIEGLLQYQADAELFLYTPEIKNIKGKEWGDSLPKNAHFNYPHSYLEKKLPSIWRSFLMFKDLQKDKLDIFHGLSHEIPYNLDNLPFKKVVTMHDLIFLRYPDFFPLIDRLVYAQKFKHACKHSDLILAICEQTKTDLINLLGIDEKKIKIHYQSCSPIFYQDFSQDNIELVLNKYKVSGAFILNVGAFEDRKNQLTLLEAYANVANKIEANLVFVGEGKTYKAQVEQRVLELNLKSRVHIFSGVSFFELPAFYQAAKVFCFPSLFEGFGIPIIEALFSKAPVITSIGSCFPESAGPNSFFIDPLSQSEIANALVQVLSNETLRNQMITSGFEYVQRFHRKNSTLKLIEYYSQT